MSYSLYQHTEIYLFHLVPIKPLASATSLDRTFSISTVPLISKKTIQHVHYYYIRNWSLISQHHPLPSFKGVFTYFCFSHDLIYGIVSKLLFPNESVDEQTHRVLIMLDTIQEIACFALKHHPLQVIDSISLLFLLMFYGSGKAGATAEWSGSHTQPHLSQ